LQSAIDDIVVIDAVGKNTFTADLLKGFLIERNLTLKKGIVWKILIFNLY